MSTSLTQSPHRKITTGSPLVSAGNNERKGQTLFDRPEFNTVSNVAIESSSLSDSFHSLNGTPRKITSGIYNNDEIPVITLTQESFPSLPTLSDISSPVGSDVVGCENESSYVSASDLTIDYGKSPKSSSPSVAQEVAALKNITIDTPVITDEENNIVESSDLLPNLLNVTKNIEKSALRILDETQTLQREQSKATTKYTADNSLTDIILSLQTVEINGSIAYEEEKQIEQANPQEATYCKLDVTQEIVTEEAFDSEGEVSAENLDQTVRLNNTTVHAVEEEQYNLFKPQRQSTSLSLFKNQYNVDDELPPAGQLDISKPLLNIADESEAFASATSEIFQDPQSFDFFLAQSTNKPVRLRTESLYVKFDPLVENATMLSPQEKNEASNEEQNGRCEALENVGTPKRSSAVAAIDRLLFFSPFPGSAESKIDKHEEKKEIEQEALESIDIDMCKELNIVRATVLQLEDELEKQRKEHEAELKRQSAMYQEKITKLQRQLAQEIEDKNQVTVVVEEYEKSISRLVAEKERARATFEQDKVKLNEDLQAANLHLNNTEAAFNDIHQKYERLKGVVSAYKINETVLKEGIQENLETIKALEARYDQLKQHATAQLEKSNADLDVIRKQHESERISLRLLATRAEVKNNSVTELVEKVARENQELAQILDQSGNDSPLPKTSEHEVKVRFAREFADVGSVTYSGPESLSSASSFHSLSSTLSTKSSSGICPDDHLPSVTVSQENVDYSSVPTVSNLSSSAGSEAGEIIFSDSNAVPQTDDIGLNPSPRSLSPVTSDHHRGHSASFGEKTFNDFVLAEGSDLDRKSVKAQEPLPPDVLNLTDELLESLTNRLGGIQLEAEALRVQQLETESRANVEEYVPVEESVHVEHPYIREYPSSVKSLFPTKEYPIDSLFAEKERPSIEHLFATNSVDGFSVVGEHSPVQEHSPTLGLSIDREFSPAQDHPFVPSESEYLHFEEHSPVQDRTFTPERLPVEEHYPVQEHSTVQEYSSIQEYSPVEHIPVQQYSSVGEQHCVEHISVQKHSPVREHHPVEHISVEKHSAIREHTPVEHNSVEKHSPIREHTPVEHNSVEKHSPIREHTPVEHNSIHSIHNSIREDSPIRERTPVVNSPIQKHSLIQEHPLVESIPVQEYPFAQGQPSEQTHPLPEERSRIAESNKLTRDSDTPTEKQASQFETVDLTLSFNGANCTRSFAETSLEPRAERVENLQAILDNRKADLSEETESVGIVKEDKGPLTTFSLDETITLDDASLNLAPAEKDQEKQFEPSQRENNIAPAAVVSNDQQSFEEFQLAAEGIANDIFKSSLELTEEATRFPDIPSEPAISECDINELFQDPECFDFLLTRGNSRNPERLRAESLYVKFDPLVANTSMLPQGNSQPISEEQNGKIEPPLVNSGTPKHNPAIAAIDRLLFYSPLPSGTECKAEKIQEKKEQPVPEIKPDITPNVDINVSKELELVRATVLQLEEELQKQKKEYEDELARQKSGYQEKVSKLQTQLAQEVKNKNQMTVVVEEYEKSISRLVAERERDRTSLEHEKTKLQEELQAANHHLSNTEAAFNDVHQKYERIKGVVWAYKTNETVLKESIQENLETIKDLETRYDQLKNHAMHQLEKANSDLDVIRKQHDTERLKLHAMVRKAELKSNTLAGLVEQVTKENKELMQILDEVIAGSDIRTTID